VNILVTGTAGFIGYHTAKRLCEQGHRVLGLDNINDYYDVNLKYGRLEAAGIKREDIRENRVVKSRELEGYGFMKINLEDKGALFKVFEEEKIDRVCHLAAQPGVRYSLENPHAYVDSNIVAFVNMLEACRYHDIQNLVYASSSSVYGLNEKMPFSTHHNVDHPVSLYAATKKSMELLAHTYSHLFNLPTVGLRFFTVYGPWGRPDMAIFKFVKNILAGRIIDVYNHGEMERDFTFVEDIVQGIIKTIDNPPRGNGEWDGNAPDPSSGRAPYKIYNIGNNKPVALMDFIRTIEEITGKKANMNMLPMQPGDVPATWADCSDLERDFGYKPSTPLSEGVKAFVDWYRSFYKQ